ncbi:MAG: phosphoribosylformylglycinamidine synthase subunit PurL [bacterium]|nr:phosphoribosylformylglycinamidine synthase subunit PurL [bacterium]
MLEDRPWEAVGLTEEEYRRCRELLGREPNHLELGLVGLMWSEHCSYKTSKVHLAKLPNEGPGVLQGPGENAGVIDLGDGLALAFKIESHNHPSAIEPLQGAATGVGGILRDIITMGAHPIAILDSLRFGLLEAPRNRYLFAGVVAGIGWYGNCFGCPTVGGEVYCEPVYDGNPLVNAMCLGLVRTAGIIRGRAEGPGNPVLLAGAPTGRDGIHGASLLASREFDEKAEERRPSVQVGDPFLGKLLLEACLEARDTGLLVGVNDLGAAGLTSACSETASRAGTGIELELDEVPRREPGMTPYEVMLSESQERMLIIARQGGEEVIARIFRRWGLEAKIIGRVTADGMIRVREGGRMVAEVPAAALTREAPVYHRPERAAERPVLDLGALPDLAPSQAGAWLARLMGSANLASREWVYRQYDHLVGVNTALRPGSDAAVLRFKDRPGGVAAAVDGNGRHCWLAPRLGGALAVAEAARNLTVSGARPVALTNCLNFGNPERPEIMWEFREVIEGMAEACRALGTPVTGGNVSFYNETLGQNIYPTPVVGMVGLLDDIAHVTRQGFQSAGDRIILLGRTRDDLGGGEYLKLAHGLVAGPPPGLDLEAEVRVQALCLEAIRAGMVRSAHDCSDGGLAVALAEMAVAGGEGARGLDVDLAAAGGSRLDTLLFGETPSRIVLAVAPAAAEGLLALARRHGVAAVELGVVTDGRVVLRQGGRTLVDEATADLEAAWKGALPCLMAG